MGRAHARGVPADRRRGRGADRRRARARRLRRRRLRARAARALRERARESHAPVRRRPHARVHRRAPARPQPPPRAPGRGTAAADRRRVGSRDGARVPRGLPRARHRGRAQRTHVPADRRRRREAAARRARPLRDPRRRAFADPCRARAGVRRRRPARPQPASDPPRLAGDPGGRRRVGRAHRPHLPARLPRARCRARARDPQLPRDRRRARPALGGRARARGQGGGGARARAAPALRQAARRHPVTAGAARRGAAAASGASRAPRAAGPRRPAAPASSAVAATIRAHGGRYEDHIVAASARSRVPVSLICAVLEMETGFANVFGHDRDRNRRLIFPAREGRADASTALYRRYKRGRARNGNQGVGPMQLTSAFLQDAADKLGGCWQPGPNIRVGVEFLAGNIKRTGSVRGGLVAYNGSPAYAGPVMELEEKWRRRLAGAGGVAGAAPRTFRLRRPRMTGSDVAAFQRLLNKRLELWKVPAAIAEDGEFGPATRRAARQVARGLGLAAAEYEHGITLAVRILIRHPSRRTPAQRERAARRVGWRKRLRASAARAQVSSSALLNGHSAPKPPAFERVIARAHARGLVVTSTNDGKHAATSFHYRDRAVDFGVPGPLIGTKQGRDRLVAFQRELARHPRGLAELFGPDNAACVKNGAIRPLAEGTDLENQHDNHVHVAI